MHAKPSANRQKEERRIQHHSAVPPLLDDEKVRQWVAKQRELARKADVPHTEGFVDACGSDDGRYGGKPDESFVHRRFLLPKFNELLRLSSRSTEEEKDREETRMTHSEWGTGSSATHPGGPWSALLRQLQWDASQQQQYQIRMTEMASSDGTAHPLPQLRYAGGIDISFLPGTAEGVACLAVLSYPSLACVGTYMHRCTLPEPYVSGFLAFRELQPVLELFDSVKEELRARQIMPQLLLVDGNGVQHPRRCGWATHLGVVLDIPTIGCSKTLLEVDGLTRPMVESAMVQRTASPRQAATAHLPTVLPLIGTSSPPLLYGYAVRGRLHSVKKCIYVSPGHGVGFAVATALVVTLLRYRIPEPIRVADQGSRAYVRQLLLAGCALPAPLPAHPRVAPARDSADLTQDFRSTRHASDVVDEEERSV